MRPVSTSDHKPWWHSVIDENSLVNPQQGALNAVTCFMTFAKSDITCPIWSKVKPFRVMATPVAFPTPHVAATVSQPVRA